MNAAKINLVFHSFACDSTAVNKTPRHCDVLSRIDMCSKLVCVRGVVGGV